LFKGDRRPRNLFFCNPFAFPAPWGPLSSPNLRSLPSLSIFIPLSKTSGPFLGAFRVRWRPGIGSGGMGEHQKAVVEGPRCTATMDTLSCTWVRCVHVDGLYRLVTDGSFGFQQGNASSFVSNAYRSLDLLVLRIHLVLLGPVFVFWTLSRCFPSRFPLLLFRYLHGCECSCHCVSFFDLKEVERGGA